MKRLALNILKFAAGIAGVVFLFAPLHTAMGGLICMASFLIAIVCAAASAQLDDDNTGYWPK